jgi:hypothetical protein
MVVHTCNPSYREAEQEDFEFETSLGNTLKAYLNNEKKPKTDFY